MAKKESLNPQFPTKYHGKGNNNKQLDKISEASQSDSSDMNYTKQMNKANKGVRYKSNELELEGMLQGNFNRN